MKNPIFEVFAYNLIQIYFNIKAALTICQYYVGFSGHNLESLLSLGSLIYDCHHFINLLSSVFRFDSFSFECLRRKNTYEGRISILYAWPRKKNHNRNHMK